MPTGFIYSIVCNETGKVYYGSTTENVSERIRRHNCSLKSWKEGKYEYCASFEIIERNNYTVSTLETVEFEIKKELYERERFYIENNECINRYLPVQTAEERTEFLRQYALTEKRKEQMKIWAKNNKEKTREYSRRYYEKNNGDENYKEKRREYMKIWWENNKEKTREYSRRSREKKRNGGEPASNQQLHTGSSEL